MQINSILLAASIALGFAGTSLADGPRHPIPLQKQAFNKHLQQEFCGHLFEKEWTSAVGKVTEAIEKNGFKVGVGSKMEVIVDGNKKAEGLFLGRIVDTEFKTTDFMFEDPAGHGEFLIPAGRCEIRIGGEKVAMHELQSISSTRMQLGETCAVSAVINFYRQLLEAGLEGNGILRKELQMPEGYMDLQEDAYDYYMKTRGGGNFKPILEHLGEKYGYVCHAMELANPEAVEKVVNEALGRGHPALIEFYIGNEMKISDYQWINTALGVGDDKRFWAPRAVGEKNGGGHALVAVESYEALSGKRKLLIKDSDWKKRPVKWDYEKYFQKRIKSSGMLAHYCENLPK